jgi:exodeoxyribonuclease VII large subunit
MPRAQSAASKHRPFTVGEVLSQLKACLSETFLPLAVKGEVCDTRQPRSGHLYFTLRDRSARLRIVVFRNTLASIKHSFRDGDQLVVWGRLDAYPKSGSVQIIASRFEPAGLGQQHVAREALRRALAAEGLFAAERKKALPPFPLRIGLVTSPTGSAIHDVLSTLRRRYPVVEVLLAPARTNGEAAGPSVAAALRALDLRGECDVLLVVRGGGSREDLVAFDSEGIVRTLAECRTPVVVGVGHEDDTTLADLAGDRRAPTPTGAAELVVPDRRELLAELAARERRVARAMGERIGFARRRLATAARAHGLRLPGMLLARRRGELSAARRRLELAHPAARLALQREGLGRVEAGLARAARALVVRRADALEGAVARLRQADPSPQLALRRRALDALEARLRRALQQRSQAEGERLLAAAARLEGLSPLRVLARGYSLTRQASGEVVRDASDLQVGAEVSTLLARGSFTARVTSIHADPSDPSAPE